MSEASYPTDFFYVNRILQRITGFWMPGKEIHVVLRVLYYSYVSFAYALTTFFFICECIIFRETVKDPNKFVRQLAMMFTHLKGIMMLHTLVFSGNSIGKVMEVIQDEKYVYEAQGEFQPGLMLQKARRVTCVLSVMVRLIKFRNGYVFDSLRMVEFDEHKVNKVNEGGSTSAGDTVLVSLLKTIAFVE